MKSRWENRVAVSRSVRVFGTDSLGNPFSKPALTLDVSLHGACLQVDGKGDLAGQTIGIRHRDEKARFRVVWVAKAGAGQQQIGLYCVDHGAYIWDVFPPKAETEENNAEQAETIDAVSAVAGRDKHSGLIRMEPTTPVRERRTGPRFSSAGSAELRTQAADAAQWASLFDLSAQGCYLELRGPWPAGTCLRVIIDTAGLRFETKALVVTSHPMIGMGLRFTEMTEANRQRLQLMLKAFQPHRHQQDEAQEEDCAREQDSDTEQNEDDALSSENALRLARHLAPGQIF